RLDVILIRPGQVDQCSAQQFVAHERDLHADLLMPTERAKTPLVERGWQRSSFSILRPARKLEPMHPHPARCASRPDNLTLLAAQAVQTTSPCSLRELSLSVMRGTSESNLVPSPY